MPDHNPFAAAERLAPVPATREDATTNAWVRHYAALGLAAFTAFHNEVILSGPRPNLGHLATMGVAAVHAAVALTSSRWEAPGVMWDLTPEAGALNGEWQEWLAELLDEHGINPADIDPAYSAADFRSPAADATRTGSTA